MPGEGMRQGLSRIELHSPCQQHRSLAGVADVALSLFRGLWDVAFCMTSGRPREDVLGWGNRSGGRASSLDLAPPEATCVWVGDDTRRRCVAGRACE